MAINNSFKILSLEAKDIYAAMNLVCDNPVGYDIRNREGKINLRKFENTLDWSLDTIKLQEEYTKETRRKYFYFTVGDKRYTQTIINVTFSFSYKLYNKAGMNTFVLDGYSLRDCEMEDGVCVQGGKLIAIQTNVEIQNPVEADILGEYFTYANGCYLPVKTPPVLMTKADLRRYIYENGFVCDGIKYVRYKRSSGSSRVGKCLFVDERLANRMTKWDRCGLKIEDGQAIDLAAYESYISLPMSSIIDTMEIEPENILIVDDFTSKFEDDVVAVEQEVDHLVSQRKVMSIENSIWDGESLMDTSMFGKYADKGMLLLRNRFFKTCAFNTNIQQWFADNGITSVKQLNGFTLAEDISQIKIITTPSSVKYLKFGTIQQWLKNIDHTFGIVKYEKETHFFDGRMVQCHYQLLNSLQLSCEDMRDLLTPSLEYIGAVRQDPAVLRYHIGYAFVQDEDSDLESTRRYKSKNDIIFKMLGINNKFAQTKIYKEFRDSLVKGFYRNLKKGHILLNGNYSTLLGNGIELLQHAIGRFEGMSILPPNCIHSVRFGYEKTILGTRSPHILAGNVLLTKNIASTAIDTYFNLTPEIVYVNSIGENILQKLNGADYDSDTMLLTDNELLVNAASKNYELFKVPTNFVEAQKNKRFYNAEHKTDLDVKTSVNKIGEIVNLSQQLNSLYWERRANGESVEECEELYNDICKLAVLSGIEIDRAKKEFVINSGKEINTLKKKYRLDDDGKTVKPMFFKMITQENGYELSPNTKYRHFKTSMDYLQKIISSTNYRQSRQSKTDTISFMDTVRAPSGDAPSGYYYALRDKIIEEIKNCKSAITKCYIGYDTMDKKQREDAREAAATYKLECMNTIDGMSSNECLMYLVLKEVEKKENTSIKTLMFDTLFGKPNETFMCMIDDSKERIDVIEEDEGGEEVYYGLKFRRLSLR